MALAPLSVRSPPEAPSPSPAMSYVYTVLYLLLRVSLRLVISRLFTTRALSPSTCLLPPVPSRSTTEVALGLRLPSSVRKDQRQPQASLANSPLGPNFSGGSAEWPLARTSKIPSVDQISTDIHHRDLHLRLPHVHPRRRVPPPNRAARHPQPLARGHPPVLHQLRPDQRVWRQRQLQPLAVHPRPRQRERLWLHRQRESVPKI
jgi:hypothetical protein